MRVFYKIVFKREKLSYGSDLQEAGAGRSPFLAGVSYSVGHHGSGIFVIHEVLFKRSVNVENSRWRNITQT